ncbi:MAG TPA: O-antigen ligase domain-containing protein, partial [Sphingomicrobium sp.]|nr:O-antigen ligase domain-containing protein [Sphingomicrobium sp.]
MIGRESLRQGIVPAYIFLCIVLGGSGQGIWGNLVLQLLGIALIGWAVLAAPARPTGVALRRLALIAIAAIALVALQLVPLPPGLWTNLPGRNLIAQGYNSLGEPLPWLPLSLAPYRTLASALFLIPPIAVLVGVAKLQACRRSWAVGAILLATLLSVFLGYIQVSTRSPSWYLYDFSNFGSAVGFFANRDHMGTLLLVAIPFIAVVLANGRGRERGEALAI